MKAHELHSEELREEVGRLVNESARLREVAKHNELQVRAIAERLAEIEKEMVAHSVTCGAQDGSCVEWRPGTSHPVIRSSSQPRRLSVGSARKVAAAA